jgi:hypothetical protein
MFGLEEDAPIEEIHDALIRARGEAELRPREMKLLEQALAMRPEIKNDFHANGHNGEGDKAGIDGS